MAFSAAESSPHERGSDVFLFSEEERVVVETISRIATCNPFLPERIALEQQALGVEFTSGDDVWHIRSVGEEENPNLDRICDRGQALLDRARATLARGHSPTPAEFSLYEDLVLFVIYHRYRQPLHREIARRSPSGDPRLTFYRDFLSIHEHYLSFRELSGVPAADPAHHFAIFFQIRRAFDHIFSHLAGSSRAAARLRAQVWQSIFTHDIRRYRRVLYDRMRDIATLVTGPSGTGKELVARAIGLSRYIPFDAKSLSFREDFVGSFCVLNLSALSPTLIESELFGHRRGAFTGAVEDRHGWLEVCPKFGTVFLDEIGDIDATIQVKLLRVLQNRIFQRLGDTQTRHFEGKVITATNRDLAQEMQEGRFREDLYYRLCSDIIVTPPLSEQLHENPDELRHLVFFIAQRIVGDEAEALTREVVTWIEEHLGSRYPWPGNFRELEQCVRNILIRMEYHPSANGPRGAKSDLAQAILEGSLSADELLRCYCTWVYSETENYEETARRLNLDRRTVKSKIDPELLEQYRLART